MEKRDRQNPSTSHLVENLVDGTIDNNIDVNDPIIKYLVKNEGLVTSSGCNDDVDLGSDDSDLEVLIEEHILLEKLKQVKGKSLGNCSDPLNSTSNLVNNESAEGKDVAELLSIKAKIEEAMHINLKIREELLSMEKKLINKYKEACTWEEGNSKVEKAAETKSKFNPVGPSERFLDKFRNPYFKMKGSVASWNSDSEKIYGTVLPLIPEFDMWNGSNIANLCTAIRKFLISEQTSLRRNKKLTKAQEPTPGDLRRLQIAPLYELIRDREDDSLDWKEISLFVNQSLLSDKDCRQMWSLYIKPSLLDWTPDEHEKLLEVAKKNNLQNWDKIAEELDTGRSGFDSFLHYQTSCLLEWNDGKWSKEEGDHLVKVVENSKIGSHISWDKVHYFIDTKYVEQIYSKWNAFRAPYIVKGPFTEREDKILLGMVHKFGADLRSVASVLKNRSIVQLTARYKDHLLPQLNFKVGEWTVEEDEKLLQLVKEHGETNWAIIAKDFETRSRVQIRHRYRLLKTKFTQNPDLNLKLMNRPKRPTSKKRMHKNKIFYNKVISTKAKNIRSMIKFENIKRHAKQLKPIDRRLEQYFRMKFISEDVEEIEFVERLKEDKKNHASSIASIEEDPLNIKRARSLLSSLKFSMFAVRNVSEAEETDSWCLKDRTSFHKGILELATLNEQTAGDLVKWHKVFCSLFGAGAFMSHVPVLNMWRKTFERISKESV